MNSYAIIENNFLVAKDIIQKELPRANLKEVFNFYIQSTQLIF